MSKNFRPFKLLEKERLKEKEMKLRLVVKDKIRRQGRTIPSKEENDYERNLQMIATKGVVRLFNAVSHQQTEIKREIVKNDRIKNDVMTKKLEMDKSKLNSNDTIIKKIMAKEKKWKVFEDDEDEVKNTDKVEE